MLARNTQTTSIDLMTTNEKIAALRDLIGLNQNRFAKLIGVAPSTMTRLERGAPSTASLDTLQKIANTFEEVSVDWLEDETDEKLPAHLTVRGGLPYEALTTTSDHEGQRLQRFVKRYKPTLNQQVIGNQMGVSRNQVHAYYSTGRFHTHVRESLLKALSKLLDRKVTPEEVFGAERGNSSPSTQTNLVAIPRISVADRNNLTNRSFLAGLQDSFMPAVKPDTAMYAPKQVVAPEQHKRAYAIEVGTGDRMEPLYFPGYWVLGLTLEPSEYHRLYDGTVAILTADGEFMLKKVIANNLRTTGVLELGSYTAERGGTVQLRKTDIQLMFSISGIIFGIIG